MQKMKMETTYLVSVLICHSHNAFSGNLLLSSDRFWPKNSRNNSIVVFWDTAI